MVQNCPEIPEDRIKTLVAAIILNSLRDLFLVAPPGINHGNSKTLSTKNYKQLVREDAWRWFWSDRYAPWSFLYCCETLDINAQAVRRELSHNPDGIKSRVRSLHRIATLTKNDNEVI